jgi:hypothetical protein
VIYGIYRVRRAQTTPIMHTYVTCLRSERGEEERAPLSSLHEGCQDRVHSSLGQYSDAPLQAPGIEIQEVTCSLPFPSNTSNVSICAHNFPCRDLAHLHIAISTLWFLDAFYGSYIAEHEMHDSV